MINDETVLWRRDDLECVMVSCCSGAELQLRRHTKTDTQNRDDYEVVLRELYPTKSDLHERSRALKLEPHPDQ